MRVRIVLILAIMLVLTITGTAASQPGITVKKILENRDIKAGGEVKLALELTNPYPQQVKIKIRDKNVIGGNGLDIQCYEYTLPGNTVKKIEYDSLEVYQPGKYRLEPATITYTDPSTGKSRETKSNPLEIEIKGKPQGGNRQGITTIYQCNGIAMKSTSYSSSSTATISINQHGGQQPSTLPQDMQTIKQELQKQKQLEQEMAEKIENSSDFQRLQQHLKEEGYNLTSKEINPTAKTFNYHYQNGTKKATISGRIQDNKTKDLTLEEQPEREPSNRSRPLLWLAILLLTILALGLVYKWNRKNIPSFESHSDRPVAVRTIDPRREALQLLERAESLYQQGEAEEACNVASQALRTYLKQTLGDRELTTREMVDTLHHLGHRDTDRVKNCLEYWDLTKFAKQPPSPEKFQETLETAREIVKGLKVEPA